MCRLFLLFTLLPIIDLALLIKLGSLIGFWYTVGIIMGTAMLGSVLVSSQGRGLMRKVQVELAQGHIPTRSALEGVLLLIGGVLLITPGFITDVLGILLLIPLTRIPFLFLLQRWFKRQIEDGKVYFHSNFTHSGGEIIDGEVIESQIIDPFADDQPDAGQTEIKPIPLPERFDEEEQNPSS